MLRQFEPCVPSKNKTEQVTQSLGKPSFWLVGQNYLVASITHEGVHLPDNPVSSQDELHVDPNRPPTFCKKRWEALLGPLLGTHCSACRPGMATCEHAILQHMRRSTHNLRLQSQRAQKNLHPKQGSALDPTLLHMRVHPVWPAEVTRSRFGCIF